MTIFSFLNASIIIFLTILMIAGFLTIGGAYLKIRTQIAKDQERIQAGETVLFSESFVYALLQYANRDYRKDPNMEDSLKIYTLLSYAQWIFKITQMLIMISLLAIVLYMFFVIFAQQSAASPSGDQEESISTIMIRMVVPIVMAGVISGIMIGYVKGIYDEKYTSTILPDINEIYNRIHNSDGIKSLFARNMSSKIGDPVIYDWMKTETIERIKQRLLSDSPNNTVLVKRLVTLSIHDYFKNELPNYDNSPVRYLFDANTQDFDKYNPVDYIRLDCSRVIENYAYKYDIDFGSSLNPDTKLKILSDASTAIESINEKISKIRIDVQPVILYLENFFRAGFVYMLLFTLLVTLIVIRYYNLHGYIIEGFLIIKNKFVMAPLIWLYNKIAGLLQRIGIKIDLITLPTEQAEALKKLTTVEQKQAIQALEQARLATKLQTKQAGIGAKIENIKQGLGALIGAPAAAAATGAAGAAVPSSPVANALKGFIPPSLLSK